MSDVPLHIIQRGHNRLNCFFTESDYLVYLDLLALYARESGCKVHAYVLMTNHVHLLISPTSQTAPAMMMKFLGQRYTQYVNRRQQRSGTLWEGRFRSCLVDEARYLLVCHRYIELNPVRAHMVAHPGDYRWSSYAVNALGAPTSLITPHPLYLALAGTIAERRTSYQALFNDELRTDDLQAVRRATNGNFVLGDECFSDVVSGALDRIVVPQKGGRPEI
nr:transposase [Massilia aquatica]